MIKYNIWVELNNLLPINCRTMESNGCDRLKVTDVLKSQNFNKFGFKKLNLIPFSSVESW